MVGIGSSRCDRVAYASRDVMSLSTRLRTWFSPEYAKQRLREGRTSGYAAELARVVDRAVNRLRSKSGIAIVTDGLRKVQFTVIENPSKAIARPKALSPG